jgi:hypothetical protein
MTAACASSPDAGALGEGSTLQPRIVGVDSTRPPRSVSIQLDQPSYVALLLVAPGHSATLLYPSDSSTSNRMSAGTNGIAFEIPSLLVGSDSGFMIRRPGERSRTDSARPAGARARAGTPRDPTSGRPIPPETPTYLLLVTSPQPLQYARILEKTAGVSIPLVESEALNAVGKAIKSTLQTEPREWAGYFQLVELTRSQ